MDSDKKVEGKSKNTILNGDSVLDRVTVFWFLTALIGQWLFVYYIIAHYGGNLVQGDLESWNNTTLKGHVSGDSMGNAMFAAHVFMAAIITFGGTLQLIPQIRRRAISLHKWNGRLFILMAFLMAFGGLYLIWIRDATLTLVGSLGTSLNAVLIIIFAGMAIKTVRFGNIVAHRRWALRTFLMVNGVWFFRVGMMAWIIINQGPAGSTENLDGPFDMVWAFANFLIPLFILEIYFITQKKSTSIGKYLMAVGLFIFTIIMGIGIFGAFAFMWKPYL